jgi:hypothetical protein
MIVAVIERKLVKFFETRMGMVPPVRMFRLYHAGLEHAESIRTVHPVADLDGKLSSEAKRMTAEILAAAADHVESFEGLAHQRYKVVSRSARPDDATRTMVGDQCSFALTAPGRSQHVGASEPGNLVGAFAMLCRHTQEMRSEQRQTWDATMGFMTNVLERLTAENDRLRATREETYLARERALSEETEREAIRSTFKSEEKTKEKLIGILGNFVMPELKRHWGVGRLAETPVEHAQSAAPVVGALNGGEKALLSEILFGLSKEDQDRIFQSIPEEKRGAFVALLESAVGS